MDLENIWEEAAFEWADNQSEEFFGDEVNFEYLEGEQGYFIAGNYTSAPEDCWPDEGDPSYATGLIKFKTITYEVTFSCWEDESPEVYSVTFRSGINYDLDYCKQCDRFVDKDSLEFVAGRRDPYCPKCLEKHQAKLAGV